MPRTPPDSSPPSRGKSEPRVSGWSQAPPSRGTSGPPPFFVSCFSFFRRRSEFEKRDENYLWCFFLPCLAFFPRPPGLPFWGSSRVWSGDIKRLDKLSGICLGWCVKTQLKFC